MIMGLGAPANAQSLFDALFGSSAPKPPVAYPGASQRLAPAGGMMMPYPMRSLPPRREDDEGVRSEPKGGGHHTVCVRMCDGYYWPISYSAPKSRFYRDANACTASCGSEARLFHYPASSSDMKEAVDLSGRAYASLPTAFKYRKALVTGCTCKPEPWSEAEMDRHRLYAMADEMAKGEQAAPAAKAATLSPPASGVVASATVADATEITDEPQTAPKVRSESAASEPGPHATTAARQVGSSRSADAQAARPRPRAGAPTPMRAPAKPSASNSFAGGGFWGGQSQYTWPGDAPRRIR